jgi:hypothetical protein
MPRIARAVAVGFPHHVTQRSNRGDFVFEGNENVSRESYLFEKIQDWAAYLNNEDNEMVGKLRKSTLTGRPCGASGFIGEMESLLHRNLHAASVGRPRLIKK